MNLEEANKLLKGSLEDKITAYKYFADKMHSTLAMIQLANYYYSIDNIDECIHYFNLASDYKDIKGYNSLGSMYLYGKKVEKDYQKAFKYFTKSYLLGDDFAKLKLADMYFNGLYVEKNARYALQYLEPLYDKYYNLFVNNNLKDNLFMEVLMRYSKCYEEGIGFKKDKVQALKCMIVARDGLNKAKDIDKKNTNLYNYCVSEVNRLKENVEDNKFELLEFCLDYVDSFSYEYNVENDYVSLNFNFGSKKVLVSTNDLMSTITDHYSVKFIGIDSFNAMEMEIMRPIDFQNRSTLFRLYDSEQTLLHFKFQEYVESLKINE